MLQIDFGSGYNPLEGFKTCDFVPNPKLDYFYHDGEIEGLNEPVNWFRLRNVIHHLPDIRKTIQDLKKYLAKDGVIEIIEVRKDKYKSNTFLDKLWYRFVVPRKDIFISAEWRDYLSIMRQEGFRCRYSAVSREKEYTEWTLKN